MQDLKKITEQSQLNISTTNIHKWKNSKQLCNVGCVRPRNQFLHMTLRNVNFLGMTKYVCSTLRAVVQRCTNLQFSFPSDTPVHQKQYILYLIAENCHFSQFSYKYRAAHRITGLNRAASGSKSETTTLHVFGVQNYSFIYSSLHTRKKT